MTPERIAQHRSRAVWLIDLGMSETSEALTECLDEIERLQKLLYPLRDVMTEAQAESIWGKPQP